MRDALRNWVPFAHFKKCEKHQWRSFTFSSKVAGRATLLKVKLLHGCFPRFLNCPNGTKSRKVSLMYYCDTINIILERIIQEPDEIMVENFDVRRVNNFKDVEELAVDTYLVSLMEFTYFSILSSNRKCLVKKIFL